MNKKKWLLLSLVMMFTIVLVACGNSGETISENYSSDMKIETENERGGRRHGRKERKESL